MAIADPNRTVAWLGCNVEIATAFDVITRLALKFEGVETRGGAGGIVQEIAQLIGERILGCFRRPHLVIPPKGQRLGDKGDERAKLGRGLMQPDPQPLGNRSAFPAVCQHELVTLSPKVGEHLVGVAQPD